MKLLTKWIPDYARKPLIFMVVFQLFVYSGSKFLTFKLSHHNYETSLDFLIPFLAWSVIFYIGTYAFWIVGTILCVRYDRNRAFRFFCADAICKLISLLFFLFLPTTNTRPEITGSGIFDMLMRLLYAVDTPDNLFPSMHCSLSWLCCLGMWGEKRIPKAYRIVAVLFTLAIFVSTLTTKQHVIIDVIGGFLLATSSWYLCRNQKIVERYRQIFEK